MKSIITIFFILSTSTIAFSQTKETPKRSELTKTAISIKKSTVVKEIPTSTVEKSSHKKTQTTQNQVADKPKKDKK